MSRLSKFVGSYKEVDVRGEKFKLYPLSVDDISLFNPNQNLDNKEKLDIGIKMLQKSLKEDKPTEEEIKSLDIKIFKLLMEEVNKLNGFEQDEQTGKVKSKIEQIRSRIAQQKK